MMDLLELGKKNEKKGGGVESKSPIWETRTSAAHQSGGTNTPQSFVQRCWWLLAVSQSVGKTGWTQKQQEQRLYLYMYLQSEHDD